MTPFGFLGLALCLPGAALDPVLSPVEDELGGPAVLSAEGSYFFPQRQRSSAADEKKPQMRPPTALPATMVTSHSQTVPDT